MSTNLMRNDCYFCGGRVRNEESPRPITRVEAGHLFPEYEGLVVADARCVDCCARYLAWVDERQRARNHSPARRAHRHEAGFDSSFRSTFNDEPGRDDLPRYNIVTLRQRRPLVSCSSCGKEHSDSVHCVYARDR